MPNVLNVNADNLSEAVDELLKEYRDFRRDVPIGDALKLKLTNNYNGVSEEVQKRLEQLAHLVREGVVDNKNPELVLKIVDVFILYANHLDKQTSIKVNPMPEQKKKETTVLAWLDIAYSLMRMLKPEHVGLIDKIRYKGLAENEWPLLCEHFSIEQLSTLSMLFHYLRALRYVGVSTEEKLPMLQAAVSMSEHLAQMQHPQDRHYYLERTSTFALPVVMDLRELGRYEDALTMAKEQLQKVTDQSIFFLMVQWNVQCAEILTKLAGMSKENDSLEKSKEAIGYAGKALEIIEQTVAIEDLRKHTICFNARVATMNGHLSQARALAQGIKAEYETDKSCGAKPSHLKAADHLLSLAPRESVLVAPVPALSMFAPPPPALVSVPVIESASGLGNR